MLRLVECVTCLPALALQMYNLANNKFAKMCHRVYGSEFMGSHSHSTQVIKSWMNWIPVISCACWTTSSSPTTFIYFCLYLLGNLKLLTRKYFARTPLGSWLHKHIIIMLFRCFDLKFLNIYALFQRIFRRTVHKLIFFSFTQRRC